MKPHTHVDRPTQPNAALTRGPQRAGAEGPCAQGPSRSNGLVGAAKGGAGRDMDQIGATAFDKRRRGYYPSPSLTR